MAYLPLGSHMEIECLRLDFHVCMTWQLVCQRVQVEAPGNQVLETRFPIGLFQNLKISVSPLSHSHSHSHPHPLTLTQTRAFSLSHKPTHSHTKNLSLTHSHRVSLTHADHRSPSHSLSLTDADRRSPSHSLSTDYRSPSHSLTHQPSLTPLSITLSTLTQIPSPKEQRCMKRSSQSFEVLQSTRSLKKKKKKVSPFMQNAKCVSPCVC